MPTLKTGSAGWLEDWPGWKGIPWDRDVMRSSTSSLWIMWPRPLCISVWKHIDNTEVQQVFGVRFYNELYDRCIIFPPIVANIFHVVNDSYPIPYAKLIAKLRELFVPKMESCSKCTLTCM